MLFQSNSAYINNPLHQYRFNKYKDSLFYKKVTKDILIKNLIKPLTILLP